MQLRTEPTTIYRGDITAEAPSHGEVRLLRLREMRKTTEERCATGLRDAQRLQKRYLGPSGNKSKADSHDKQPGRNGLVNRLRNWRLNGEKNHLSRTLRNQIHYARTSINHCSLWSSACLVTRVLNGRVRETIGWPKLMHLGRARSADAGMCLRSSDFVRDS